MTGTSTATGQHEDDHGEEYEPRHGREPADDRWDNLVDEVALEQDSATAAAKPNAVSRAANLGWGVVEQVKAPFAAIGMVALVATYWHLNLHGIVARLVGIWDGTVRPTLAFISHVLVSVPLSWFGVHFEVPLVVRDYLSVGAILGLSTYREFRSQTRMRGLKGLRIYLMGHVLELRRRTRARRIHLTTTAQIEAEMERRLGYLPYSSLAEIRLFDRIMLRRELLVLLRLWPPVVLFVWPLTVLTWPLLTILELSRIYRNWRKETRQLQMLLEDDPDGDWAYLNTPEERESRRKADRREVLSAFRGFFQNLRIMGPLIYLGILLVLNFWVLK